MMVRRQSRTRCEWWNGQNRIEKICFTTFDFYFIFCLRCRYEKETHHLGLGNMQCRSQTIETFHIHFAPNVKRLNYIVENYILFVPTSRMELNLIREWCARIKFMYHYYYYFFIIKITVQFYVFFTSCQQSERMFLIYWQNAAHLARVILCRQF